MAKRSTRFERSAWIPVNESVVVQGFTLHGGLIYVGAQLSSPRGPVDPALINPTLRVDSRHPDLTGEGLSYWPSYSELSPASRAAYLTWLEEGRRNPRTPVGYVFLFFYGLEHRALLDLANNPDHAGELSGIENEVRALLTVYGPASGSFRGYASHFLDILQFLKSRYEAVDTEAAAPPLIDDRWSIPLRLRVGLGTHAVDAAPLPADWALAWAWYDPNTRIRTPATRCSDEFRSLFIARYAEKFRSGILVDSSGPPIAVEYHAASSGIGSIRLDMSGVPDVIATSPAVRTLAALVDETQEQLDAFSRFVGKHPGDRQSLTALSLLPRALVESSSGEALHSLRTWLDGVVSPEGTSTVAASELLDRWGVANTSVARADAVSIAQLLGLLGIGIEPDVRFGGATLARSGAAILFPVPHGDAVSPSAEYSTATTLLQLAAAVSAADGVVSAEEVETILRRLSTALNLEAAETVRLLAHLRWLSQSEVKLTGLTKRIAAVPGSQREQLGSLLIDVAAADGTITPAEVRTVTKIFGLLGLDQDSVSRRVFAARSNQEPVLVRQGAPARAGVPIPGREPTPPPESPHGLRLDASIISKTIAESASVAVLLRDIFEEDDTLSALPKRHGRRSAGFSDADGPVAAAGATTTAAPPNSSSSARVAGLDTAHSRIVTALRGQHELTRPAFETLAREVELMPDGAIDTINEAALDLVDEPLLEGDDVLTVNAEVLEEMLR